MKIVLKPSPEFVPSAGIGVIKWEYEAGLIKERPGVWFQFITSPSPSRAMNFAGDINRGRKRAFRPRGEWQACSKDCDVYVRYCPPSVRRREQSQLKRRHR